MDVHEIIVLGFGDFQTRQKLNSATIFPLYGGVSLEGSGLELGIALAFVTPVG
jgi:hypothetical protein